MGGFVAAVPRGGPASPELIERVVAASRDRAPDGVRHVVTPEGALLVQCLFANTPESVGEALPKCDPSGRVWIVKRGHLNNIDELRGRLRDRLGPGARVHSDADVMLAAYLAWGPDMAGRIHGEFTLAIWDGRNRSLFVLRDHLGLRGCYVHDGDEWYVAASEPAQVLPFPGVSGNLDELGIVDYMSGDMRDCVRTFWTDIRRPTPATSIVVHRDEIEQRLYWVPSLCTERATRGPEHFAPAVRTAFEAAVRAALRSATPVVCDLSGGLDSSAIVGMAAKLRAADRASVPEVVAHSLLYQGLGCDELPYIRAVLSKWPLPWYGFDDLPSAPPVSADVDEWIRSIRLPLGAWSPGGFAQAEWMRCNGSRVRIGGHGGDEVFLSGPLPLARPARPRGELLPYFWWASRRSPRVLMRRVRREVVRPLVPRSLLDRYLWLVNAPTSEHSCLTDRARTLRRKLEMSPTWCSDSSQRPVSGMWNPGHLYSVGLADALSLRHGHEVRSPFFDFRLVDQLARQPILVHRWDGAWRRLQTVALADLYPDSVAGRQTKADFSDAYEQLQDTRLVHSDLLTMGLVDRSQCERALHTGRSRSAIAVRDMSRWRAIESAGRSGRGVT